MLKQSIYPTAPRKREQQIVEFRGLNYGEGTVDGELRDSAGLTSANYPILSQRPPRRKEHVCATTPNALFAWNALVEVEGTTLYYDDLAGNRRNIGEVEAGEKQFAVVANKLIIWPDKKVLDLSNPTASSLRDYRASASSAQNQNIEITANSIKFTPRTHVQNYSNTYRQQNYQAIDRCLAGAAFYTFLSYSKGQQRLAGGSMPLWDCEFSDFHNTAYPLMQVGTRLAAKKSENGRYTPIVRSCQPASGWGNTSWKSLSDWDGEPTTDNVYIEVRSITRTDIGDGESHFVDWYVTFEVIADGAVTDVGALFKAGDRVNVTGTRSASRVSIQSVTTNSSGTTVTFTTSPFAVYTGSGSITLTHDVPDLDFICAKDNRLWGFRNADQTIYASAQGLPMEFWDERGISVSSWQAPVGSAGNATAIAAYSGAVLIWKENLLYKVLGDFPSEYSYNEYNVSGVLAGSHLSQVVINEALYFLGREGVFCFTGDVPQLVTEKLGNRRFSHGIAGTDGRNYYISMQDDDTGAWGLYCFDTLRGIWIKEDDTQAAGFAWLNKSLYMARKNDLSLYELNAGDEDMIEWLAEFAPFDEGAHNHKGYTFIKLRIDMAAGAYFHIEVKQDHEATWRRVWTQAATRDTTLNVPLRIGRCDRFAIRLSGKGRTDVRSMVREFIVKSEV